VGKKNRREAERVEVAHQSSVHREDLLVDYRSDGKAVEAVCKSLPQLDVIAALAWVGSARKPG
jgi:hypothetical protein